MTLLSIIATIASLLVGIAFLLSENLLTFPSRKAIDWQKIWPKTITWFDLDKAPIWKKIFLKITFSALVIMALGCGLYDTYMSLNAETNFFLRGLISVLITAISFVCIFAFCIEMISFKNLLSENHFDLDFCAIKSWHTMEQMAKIKKRCIILNSAIICFWLADFVLYLYLGINLFAAIGFSILTTIILSYLLVGIGVICYILIKTIIISPICSYIKWLLK